MNDIKNQLIEEIKNVNDEKTLYMIIAFVLALIK